MVTSGNRSFTWVPGTTGRDHCVWKSDRGWWHTQIDETQPRGVRIAGPFESQEEAVEHLRTVE